MEIYNDDCLKVLEKLKDNSIDMILVDLPYGQTNCKWDCVIDLDKMWKLLKKCCKGNAVMVFFCTTKFGNTLINSNKKGFKYDLVWEKSRKVGFLSANKMPLRKHEMIYVFKGDKPHSSYNPQKTKGHKPLYHKSSTLKKESVYGFKNIPESYCDDTRHPTSILQFEEKPTHEMVYVFKGNKPHSTYNPQKTKGHKKSFVKGSKRKNKDVYGMKEVPDHYVDDTRHPTSVIQFEEEPTHEMVYVFKGDEPHSTYNPQKTKGHKPGFRKGFKMKEKNYYGHTETPDIHVDDTRHPTTILKFNNDNHAGGTIHRTQKPVDLCEWLIKSFSNEGEVVCDFTMGSGTTGIACLNTNRKFIGVEMDKEIFKIAKDRIDNHKKKENEEEKKEEKKEEIKKEKKEKKKEEKKKEGIKCSCGKILKKISKQHLESKYHKNKIEI